MQVSPSSHSLVVSPSQAWISVKKSSSSHTLASSSNTLASSSSSSSSSHSLARSQSLSSSSENTEAPLISSPSTEAIPSQTRINSFESNYESHHPPITWEFFYDKLPEFLSIIKTEVCARIILLFRLILFLR